ncbi:uncharacterized protein LOC143270120 [Peromyscus maniculatus bairdii]|uniref:uncharacterized protein LOC143270120 n=1 Tax=Peromyscus maniculatus bairdii TaxID=230844 RepID=UPI003FD6A693
MGKAKGQGDYTSGHRRQACDPAGGDRQRDTGDAAPLPREASCKSSTSPRQVLRGLRATAAAAAARSIVCTPASMETQRAAGPEGAMARAAGREAAAPLREH